MTQVYDPLYPIVIARMDTNGLPKRYLYNDLQQPLAVIGPDQHINNLTATFFSRQQQIYNPNDRKHPNDPIGSTFLPNYPNSTLIATPQNGGSYFQFQDGDFGGWQGGSIQANALVLQAGATARLLRSGENFGLRMQLATLVQLGAGGGGLPTSLTIAIGTTQIVCNISSAGGAFLLQNNGQQLSSLTRKQIGTDWLVIALDALLLFYVDGEQIFATQLSANITGTIQISTQGPTDSGVGLRQVLLFADPLLSIHYRDGTGKPRQSQELENSTSIIVRETLYDAQGHSSIATLPVRKGTGAQAPHIFGFEPDFVTGRDPGNGDNLWSGNSSNTRQGFMIGLIQSWLESDYQTNFPYVRQIYAPVPLPRVVATTGSHQAYSIGSPHVTTFQYGLSSSAQTLLQSLALTGQAQNYGALTSYAPIDNSTQIASVSIWDKYGNTVANGAVAGNDFKLASYARSYQNTEPQMTLTTHLPNFYENQANQTNFQLIESYNHLGEAVVRQTPDSQNTIAIYDMCGRRSFALTPTGAEQNPNLILYWKYDQLGRTTEAGYLSAAWNATTLQQLAYGQSTIWPAQPVWLKKFWYDCDYTGSITNMKGYVAEVMSRNAQPGQTGLDPASFVMYQRYTYDAWGRIRTQTLKVEEFTDLNYIISYTYDPIGNIASVTYPPVPGDTTSFTVWYHYNQRGLLDKIGKAGTGNEAFYAAYTYNADGSLQNEVLNGGGTGSTNKITRTYHYNSMGWLLSTQDDHFLSETLNYQDQSGQYLDGNISQATYTFNMASNYGYSTPENYNETYTYDAFGQLLQVTNSLQPPGSLQISDGAGNSYDANGNILAVSRGELPPTRYAYAPGTDQLRTLEGGPETLTFQYNAGGATTPWIYDCLTQLPLAVPFQSDAETRVEYRYGLGLTRVLKFVQGDAGLQQTLYVPGNQLFPLAEYDQAHGQITLHRRMIYGLRGLLAIDDGSHTYFHLKDHLGSTRLVFDEISTVHTYLAYDAFGTLLSTNSSPDVSAAPFHYRFTGQEYEPETGLYHFPARLYNSNLGRFSTPDPAGQFASPYVYAGNNPVNITDPTGMISLTGSRALGGLIPALAHGLAAAGIGAGIGAMVGGLKGMEIGLGAGFATGFGASLFMETFGVRLIRMLYANPGEYPLIFYNPDQLTRVLGIRYNTGLMAAEMIAEYEGIPRRLWNTFLIPFNRENLGGVMAEAEQAGFRGRVILVAHRTGDFPPMVEVTGVQNLAGGELVGYLQQRGLAWQNVNRVDMSICNAAMRFPGSPTSIAESFAWGIRLIRQEGDPVPSIRASIEGVTPWHPMFRAWSYDDPPRSTKLCSQRSLYADRWTDLPWC